MCGDVQGMQDMVISVAPSLMAMFQSEKIKFHTFFCTKSNFILLFFVLFFGKFSDRDIPIKCTRMHRLESRFQYMKAAGLFFHLVKARLETENAIAAFHCLPNHIFF